MVYGVRVLLLDPLQILDFNRLCHNDPMGGKQLVSFNAVKLKFLQDPMVFLAKKTSTTSTTPQFKPSESKTKGFFHANSFIGFSPFSIHVIFIEAWNWGPGSFRSWSGPCNGGMSVVFPPVRLDPFRDQIHHAKSPPFWIFCLELFEQKSNKANLSI